MLHTAYDLWLWYYAITELFDRQFPGYWLDERRMTWVPHYDFRKESNNHARECRSIIEEFKIEFDISNTYWFHAKRESLKRTI